ncbi:bifunctional proline dehydrogenase/L-glutamate gamma-semialdehyde dehydrogenase PutA [Dongshaea marina]|uniref:bifunctional proline dehydrogenase/L-glutamate gamma-semialdehyde dehydrogenase PutA n=1 Tax=Dongshaea marina TaxID=2047966 RepID=UPI0019027212|nr:bifunctional proline dehydrogenase/L-glutamate gamma-semialdehyde dehydrogenase PutA [Dongshaea marina]
MFSTKQSPDGRAEFPLTERFDLSRLNDPDYTLPGPDELRRVISHYYCLDEQQVVKALSDLLGIQQERETSVSHHSQQLIEKVRSEHHKQRGVDAFLQQYSLDTKEGIALMSLAEALQRIPDKGTADELIRDKLGTANWRKHRGQSSSSLVNNATRGLELVKACLPKHSRLSDKKRSLTSKLLTPAIRHGVYTSMRLTGNQFVLGQNIDEALSRGSRQKQRGFTHSFDMLGEAALTRADADQYLQDYQQALETIARQHYSGERRLKPSLSIKLSALHPRYEEPCRERVMSELLQDLRNLVHRARKLDVSITIDAEEMDRLELSLDLFQALYQSDEVKGWGQLGLVIQAYSKRALPVLCWLTALAKEQGDEIPVRLVKGAYWDSEIKEAQQGGLSGYPVFTRKAATDLSYLACAQFLLGKRTRGAIYPQFATHNAHSIAAVFDMANNRSFEFQRLHGMGEQLYLTLLEQSPQMACRIYAPVGAHRELLPYLVRRLLENGANSSFVHKILDPSVRSASLSEHPRHQAFAAESESSSAIALPGELFYDRINSAGLNMTIESERAPFFKKLAPLMQKQWLAGPLVNGEMLSSTVSTTIVSPQNRQQSLGQVDWSEPGQIEQGIHSAHLAYQSWSKTPVQERAQSLDKLADLLEENRDELIALCILEAGKTLQDGIDEVREAVDFCRYYARQAQSLMSSPLQMPGYTGESNLLQLEGRGVFACISPWNFPLAIFLGQIAAALVTGNTVVAKPAEQTSLIAFYTTRLAHQAGIPKEVLHLLPGDGEQVGSLLTADERIAGVCFTGSTATAKAINRSLASREGAIVPLIAETGGQNAMIADSTALPEQLVKDVIHSAFQSAGQRCSATRVLYIQEDIADRVIELLQGAMQELNVGDPALYQTDIGPVIDEQARSGLEQHRQEMIARGKLVAQAPLSDTAQQGCFVIPTVVEIDSISQLTQEHFGPILHLIRYRASELPQVITAINSTGFGLTFGIHSRNESLFNEVAERINAGNIYINRNQIGAMVGVQPFGGQGFPAPAPRRGTSLSAALCQ